MFAGIRHCKENKFFFTKIINKLVNVLNDVLRNKTGRAYDPEETSAESAIMINVARRTSYSISYTSGSNTRLDF
jgi:hypothetical protein